MGCECEWAEVLLGGGAVSLRLVPELVLGAAVTRFEALMRGCTILRMQSIEERASVHGTGGLLVGIGEPLIAGDWCSRAVEN